MENPHSRGQCLVELTVILLALTTLALTARQLADLGRKWLEPAQLSRSLK